jgi:hypothetical protein
MLIDVAWRGSVSLCRANPSNGIARVDRYGAGWLGGGLLTLTGASFCRRFRASFALAGFTDLRSGPDCRFLPTH